MRGCRPSSSEIRLKSDCSALLSFLLTPYLLPACTGIFASENAGVEFAWSAAIAPPCTRPPALQVVRTQKIVDDAGGCRNEAGGTCIVRQEVEWRVFINLVTYWYQALRGWRAHGKTQMLPLILRDVRCSGQRCSLHMILP